ncbi:hypothetical protein QA601_06665 [Chitinispirillales bacterium ANBcel5]|uniref:hypothetical protein n=1 Tax=Cellulosispirillum alkaliphilum TaxID=3039283 RepID=UPI002A546F4B|nr:hypothetical protein [Chitinispirillales bacterium ANBcel5]
MKKNVVIVLMVLGLAASTYGQTLISGEIHEISFTSENNPYIVEEDLIIPKGESVTIPEGIIFLFNAFSGIRVNGELIVNGTEDENVIFTSINEQTYNPESDLYPNPFDWNGILITREADGAILEHFSLQYSVFGIKSQISDVVLADGLFQQNGQFHFALNDQIKPVIDNIPYSFGERPVTTVDLDPPKHVDDDDEATTIPVTSPDEEIKESRGHLVLRFTSLGVAVAGGVTSIISGLRANQYVEDQNEGENVDLREWDNLEQKRRTALAISVTSGVIAGLGAIGFGVSFAF